MHILKLFFLILFLMLTIYCPISPFKDLEAHIFHLNEFEEKRDERLKKADELLEAALYAPAIETYQNIIDSSKHNQQLEDPEALKFLMQTRFHLAWAYYLTKNYEKAAVLFKENTENNQFSLNQHILEIQSLSYYLLGLTLKNLNDYNQAKDAFFSYISSLGNDKAFLYQKTSKTQSNQKNPPLFFHESNHLSHDFYQEALFEVAVINFLTENNEEALTQFLMLQDSPNRPQLCLLSKFYLARIELLKENYDQAAQILAGMNLNQNDPHFYEWNYLRGEASFEKEEFLKAINYFQQSIKGNSKEKFDWYFQALYQLGWSFLKTGLNSTNEPYRQTEYLKESEKTFENLFNLSPNEKGALALAQSYLNQATVLNQPEYYSKAENLLSKNELYISETGKEHVLLLKAEAAPSYAAREDLYKKITENEKHSSIFYAKGWYNRSLNKFEYAKSLLISKNIQEAQKLFQEAAASFSITAELLKEKEPLQAGIALKHQALAEGYISSEESNLKALEILKKLEENHPTIWNAFQNKDEIYYLQGYFAGKLSRTYQSDQYLNAAIHSLEKVTSLPSPSCADQALFLLGNIYYEHQKYEESENKYLELTQIYPKSPLAAESWLSAAYCAEKLKKDPEISKKRKESAFKSFPKSPYSIEAYFTYYTYQEYLEGDREAIKHLETFINNYSETPFLIEAHFLIGLDYKRDRKTPQGRWIRKKSLTKAIDSFQQAEIQYTEFLQNELIPEDKINYYTAMRYRATLERGMANLSIADEAQGAKKQIYLTYAETVFSELIKELEDQKNLYISHFFQNDPYPLIVEESSFWLAQTYIKANKDQEAYKILSEINKRYKHLNKIKSYYLSRTLYELGKIALRQHEFENALDLLKHAEEAGKGHLLSTDQKLELWIEQSECYKGLNSLDDAILILSKAINDDAISSLRIKAMYLRAELYTLQNRPELARKQFESMVKKGGIWARKAQEKLEKEFFNHEH